MGGVRFSCTTALAVMLAACGADPGGFEEWATGDEGAQEPETGETAQALGNFNVVWESTQYAPFHLSSNFAAFVRFSPSCTDHVLLVNRTSGFSFRANFSGGCRIPRSSGADSQLFIGDMQQDDILRLVTDELGAGWVKVADTVEDPHGKILVNSSHVFWTDRAGIRRAPRGGGSVTPLIAGTNLQLAAIDGTNLYYTRPVTGGGDDLLRIQTGGGGNTFLLTTGRIREVSQDATHLYWTDNSTDPRRLRRMNKSTLALSTSSEGSGKTYHHPHSTGSMLYWAEDRMDSGVAVRRRNLSNGNVVTVPYGQVDPPIFMDVFSDGVFTADLLPDVLSFKGAIVRGSL
jgi:hypothetical protein